MRVVTSHRGLGAIAAILTMTVIGGAGLMRGPGIRVDSQGGDGSFPLATRLGPTDPAEHVEVTLALELRRRALSTFLRDVRDPSSPRYRDFVDAAQFGERFGISDLELAGLTETVRAARLEVLATYPQRTSIRVGGTARNVGRLFGVELHDFVDPAGDRFHAPLAPPVIPTSLRGVVVGVGGLSDQRLIRSNALVSAIPVGGLKPDDTAAAYNLAPLHQMGITGEGQTIAIVSFDSFLDQDVVGFDQRVGIVGPEVEHIPVGGGTAVGQGSIEVMLDIEVIRGIAPAAAILNFEAPNDGTASFGDVVNAIVADARASIISISWGRCDVPEAFTEGLRLADQQAFEAAAAQGISTFVASGDNGAYTCEAFDPADKRLSVSWPADSPFVTSVGGTRLAVQQDGSYLREFGWEDVLSNGGGGGGLNPIDPRPDWQTGVGVDNDLSNGMRQIPDVAAAADPDSGFYVFVTNPSSGTQVDAQIGGTSAAAPFWAGSMLLVEQLAEQEGVGPLGFVNPVLYQLAATPGVFHDITRGGDRFHNATPGWDYSTGLGSPDVLNLAQAMVDLLRG
jgi:subtilase family serine protease